MIARAHVIGRARGAGSYTHADAAADGARPLRSRVALGPAHVLAVLVGLFHTGLFVFLRGRAGGWIVAVACAAILGAWAGDAIGGRLGVDPLRVGDFHVVSASIVAWIGIAFVAVIAVLGPGHAPEEPE